MLFVPLPTCYCTVALFDAMDIGGTGESRDSPVRLSPRDFRGGTYALPLQGEAPRILILGGGACPWRGPGYKIVIKFQAVVCDPPGAFTKSPSPELTGFS